MLPYGCLRGMLVLDWALLYRAVIYAQRVEETPELSVAHLPEEVLYALEVPAIEVAVPAQRCRRHQPKLEHHGRSDTLSRLQSRAGAIARGGIAGLKSKVYTPGRKRSPA